MQREKNMGIRGDNPTTAPNNTQRENKDNGENMIGQFATNMPNGNVLYIGEHLINNIQKDKEIQEKLSDIDRIIDQWIGGEKNTPYKDNHTLGDEIVWTFEDGYNQALQDLKSRKQELIEGIKKLLSSIEINNIDEDMFMNRIIKELTGK